MASSAAVPFSSDDRLLQDLLAISLTAVNLLQPLYAPSGELEDFSLEYLNPAAQRMTGLAEQPGGTLRGHFPETFNTGVFAMYKQVFTSGQDGRLNLNYQADGLDNYFRLAARRSGERLVVSFTDTADQDRSPLELALRESQAREQQARTEAQRRQEELQRVLEQAPVAIAYLEGPAYRIALANPAVCEIWTRPPQQLLGLPLLEAMPELQGQGVDDLLNGVLQTGEPFFGTELPFQLLRHGRLETIYFNFVYQPQRDAQGQTTGVLVVASDVTEVVTARLRVEAQESQTAELNEELAAANEEIRANNEELGRSQVELLLLNQELEARVSDRTAALLQSRQLAEGHQQRLERLFMQAPAAICMLSGPDLVFELVNPAYQALFPGRALRGLPLLEALPELTGLPVWHTLRQVYETGVSHEEKAMHIPVAPQEGGPLHDFYFNYLQQARYDELGRIDGLVVFAFDVTEQVVARQASVASARQLRLITDALPVLIGYLDPQQRYRFTNHAYRAWFNQDPADLLGQPIRAIAGEAAYPNIQPYLERALAGERVEFETQMPFRPDFTKVIRTVYIPDIQDGQVAGCFTLVTDITEQVAAREQVQRLNRELGSMNEELAAINEELMASNEEIREANIQLLRTNADLDNFIYSASHDLQAPISNIEGLLYALQQEMLPAPPHPPGDKGYLLELMQNSIERFKRTIGHLTAVSKLQKEHSQPSTLVNLPLVLEDVRLDLAPLLQQVGGQLQVDVRTTPLVRFSEKNLRSVLYNLLSNALKYHSPDRPLLVQMRSRVEESYVVLQVQDNGLGIEAAHLPRLFTMFQRFHDHVDGSGIGLYMIKKMVENAGGKLEVVSAPGQGSTFSVYLRQSVLAEGFIY